jgi:hypothetical protein
VILVKDMLQLIIIPGYWVASSHEEGAVCGVVLPLVTNCLLIDFVLSRVSRRLWETKTQK